MRLFIAVQIPLTEEMSELIKEVEVSGADVKMVEMENLHLTLLFIGEKKDSLTNEIKVLISDLKFKEIPASARGIGFFPNEDRPRVMWIGIVDNGKLKEVRDQIVRKFRERGISFDDRNEFSPHLTICRVKSGKGVEKLREIWRRRKDDHFVEFRINEVKLFKSTLTPRGPIYEELYSVKSQE